MKWHNRGLGVVAYCACVIGLVGMVVNTIGDFVLIMLPSSFILFLMLGGGSIKE